MATPNENNRLQVRGRLVRDPNYSRKTGPDATAAFFTLAASRPYLDATGDMKTATDWPCCTKPARDSHRGSSGIAERHVQACPDALPHPELVRLQCVAA